MFLIKRVKQFFHRLQWKLTLSYTAVTIGALLVSILILAFLVLSTIFLPYDMAPNEMWVQAANEQAVPLTRMLLAESPPNMKGIADLVNYEKAAKLESLDLLSVGNVTLYIRATAGFDMFVFDPNGALLGRTGYPVFSGPSQEFDTSTVPKLEAPLLAALAGVQDADQLVSQGEPGEPWAIAVPVFDSVDGNNRLLGVVGYVLKSMPTEDEIFSHTVRLVSASILLFLVAAGLIGTLFGFLTAKGMVKRLQRVSQVTDAWSQGDFSEFIEDPVGDEISQLASRLNEMAEQLQNYVRRSQEMAVSEERNRLARDLHDSAKQEALAASFHLGTALTLFDQDPERAKNHLFEAEGLVDSVRGELTDLIHELRPPSMNGARFDEVVNDYLIEWAHQTGIKASLNIEGYEGLSLETKQTIYRILQEALANIARHSNADYVDIAIGLEDSSAKFTVVDDGSGFDTRGHYKGIGLQTMRERAESLKGDFQIESGADQGTKIIVKIPIENI